MISSENVKAYVERMASGEPAPGGGAAGALQAALGAALVAMSARYTTDPGRADDAARTAARAEELIPRALGLADADAEAFGALADAYALPDGSADEKAQRSRAIQEATAGAAGPPRQLIGVGAEVLGLARELTGWCNPNVLSDVAAASEAARSAVATGLVTLEINLRSLKDPATQEELRSEVGRAEQAVGEAEELTRRIRERVRA